MNNTHWLDLAKELKLTWQEDDCYIGSCPFCNRQDTFAIKVNSNLAICTASGCKYQTTGLKRIAADLARLRTPVPFLGMPIDSKIEYFINNFLTV